MGVRQRVLEHAFARPLEPLQDLDSPQITGLELERAVPQVSKLPTFKLKTVINGHQGWVHAVAIDPLNEWIASGSADTTIKIWDLASGKLKLTLRGHSHTVTGLCASERHPYLFSASHDKMVKCWDLEYNKVVREYHGHLGGVYALALHPTLDIVVSVGSDAVVRVWDMRQRSEIFAMEGHSGPIASVVCQSLDPQVISGGQEAQVRLWDLAAGKCLKTLTHHAKSVRCLAVHPLEQSFVSGSRDALKQWQLPNCQPIADAQPPPSAIVDALALNNDGVLACAGDDAVMRIYNYTTMQQYQELRAPPMPGSMSSEAAVLAATFDQTGQRLITGEVDKTIKIYRAEL